MQPIYDSAIVVLDGTEAVAEGDELHSIDGVWIVESVTPKDPGFDVRVRRREPNATKLPGPDFRLLRRPPPAQASS